MQFSKPDLKLIHLVPHRSSVRIIGHSYCPQQSCGKVIFSQASVILFTGGGCNWAGTPRQVHPPTTITAAYVLHSTGMLSCLAIFLLISKEIFADE